MNSNIDNQEMRNYLLGTLEADRRTQLEERILCDPGVYEELLIVEEELIDQYVTGGLSKPEQQQFQSHFLVTAERQKNLRFGKLLNRYVTSQPVLNENAHAAVRQPRKTAPAKKSFLSSWRPLSNSPALAFSAVLLFALGIGLLWLTMRKPPNIDHQSLVIVTLTPGSIRSEGGGTQRVSVPPKGVALKLELEVANTTFDNFKSQLFRESEELQTSEKLKKEAKNGQHIVPVTITEILSPGDYQVRLSGISDTGIDEFIDNYSFRVIE